MSRPSVGAFAHLFQTLDRVGILVAQPAIGVRRRPRFSPRPFIKRSVALDHDVLDVAQQTGLNELGKSLRRHPLEEARQPRCGGQALGSAAGVGISKTLGRSVQMKGRFRYSSR